MKVTSISPVVFRWLALFYLLTLSLYLLGSNPAAEASAPASATADNVNAAEPTSAQDSSAGSYVTAVVGGTAAVVSVLGLPLMIQNYRKTKAEVEKVQLESRKLRSDLAGSGSDTELRSDGINIYMEGTGHVVGITTDPKYAISFLLLTDVIISFVYFNIAAFALNIIPLGPVTAAAKLVLFVAIFLPILRMARKARQQIGMKEGVPADPAHPGRAAGSDEAMAP